MGNINFLWVCKRNLNKNHSLNRIMDVENAYFSSFYIWLNENELHSLLRNIETVAVFEQGRCPLRWNFLYLVLIPERNQFDNYRDILNK